MSRRTFNMQYQVFALLSILLAETAQACACLAAQDSVEQVQHVDRHVVASTPVSLKLTNVRVFDGYQMKEPSTVYIDGESIGTDESNTTSTYDAGGRFLIPGLWDSHCHPPDLSAMQNLTSYGITTAIGMSCINYTACNSLRDLPGLASFISGSLSAVGPDSSHATGMKRPNNTLFFGPWQAPSAVAYAFANGSDFYKITSEVNGPSLKSQLDLVEITHGLGLQSMTHAAILSAYRDAILSRTDGIQHVPTDGYVDSWMPEAILAQNQTVTPTLAVIHAAAGDPIVAGQLGGIGSNYTQSLLYAEANAKTLYQAGITILAGTDSVGTAYGAPFGISLHQELQYLVKAGMTPAEALRAATIIPAVFHRRPDRGVIVPGMRSDLVLLNSNPLLNISNTLDLAKVWVGGVEYSEVQKLT